LILLEPIAFGYLRRGIAAIPSILLEPIAFGYLRRGYVSAVFSQCRLALMIFFGRSR
jgi:hypothetical protein